MAHPSSEQQSLLAAIAANPDDDLPRLVYADWLDENGQLDRAEFIRLQCHTARVGVTDPSWAPAKLREYDLFVKNEAEWRPESDEIVQMLSNSWRRGFPAWVPFDVVADGIVNCGEWCNGRYHLGAGENDLTRLPEFRTHPRIRPIHGLSVSSWQTHFIPEMSCGWLRDVRTIELMEWYASVSVEPVDSFCEYLGTIPDGSWTSWTRLRLDGHPSNAGLRHLMNAPAFRTVTELALWLGRSNGPRREEVSPSTWGEFVRSVASRMEALELYDVSAEQIRAMCNGVRWQKLSRLTVNWTPPSAIRELSHADMPLLTELSVAMPPRVEEMDERDTTRAIMSLAESSLTSRLSSLTISGWPASCVQPFWTTYRGHTIEQLGVWVTNGEASLPSLTAAAEIPALRGLRTLELFRAPDDLERLASPDVFPELHSLWIADRKSAVVPPGLHWQGGDRCLIVRNEESSRSPDRYGWSHWRRRSD